jgi:hypothetical protein
MEIDPSEAQKVLDEARAYSARMKKALSAYGVGYHFIIWGLVWLAEFALVQWNGLLPPPIRYSHWAVLNIAGNVFSISLGIRGRRRLKPGPHRHISLFILLFLGFGGLGALVLRPAKAEEAIMLLVLYLSLWLGSMGILARRAFLWTALAIAIPSLGAYFLLPGAFYISVALIGGAACLTTGVWLLRGRQP